VLKDHNLSIHYSKLIKEVILLFSFIIAIPVAAQIPFDADSIKKMPLKIATPKFEILATNTIINRFDVWVKKADWARIILKSWKKNINTGFQTDGDGFPTNFLGHPFS
jgi:hypothetical protein